MFWADLSAIGGQGKVCLQELCILLEQLCQIRAANLLLTLQQELQCHFLSVHACNYTMIPSILSFFVRQIPQAGQHDGTRASASMMTATINGKGLALP